MNIFQFRISSDNHACLSIHIIIIKPVEVVLMLSQIQAPIPAYQIQLPPPPNPGMSKGMERPRLSMKSCLLISFELFATSETFDHDSAKFLGATWGEGGGGDDD